MLKKLLATVLVVLGMASWVPAHAEDIDLFATPPATVTFLPNVLIILDNTANWNTAFSSEMTALASVLNGLPLNKFRVGLMLYTETGGSNGNTGGAYVRAAIRALDSGNAPLYSSLVTSLDQNNDKGNGRALGLAMAEAYLYFSGSTGYAGYDKVKRDYYRNSISPTSSYAASNNVYALSGNAFSTASSQTYVSPIQDGCQRNFIIYIGNTTANGNVTSDNTSDNTASGTLLAAAGGDTTQVTNISPVGMSDNYANEWSRFMKTSRLGISTYTIDVSWGNNGGGPDNSALLKSMANEGAGKYFYIDATTASTSTGTASLSGQIQKAMSDIFSEIQSVNSVFASVSLPVSVNTQGTYLNQVFIGMFRPDVSAAPRWAGNLKQYKMGLVGSDLKLLDAVKTTTYPDGTPAINSLTGFIGECARSFWTPSTTDTYWQYKNWPTGTTFCIPQTGSATLYRYSNSPDGNIVEKGAQAYMLRSTTSRTMYTCGATMTDCSSSTSLTAFDTSSITAAALGAATTAERDALVAWAKGQDVDDEDGDAVTTGEMRPSAHGDVVHSRPVAVNFGGATEATSKVVVFYGANDGLLRAVNGNRGDAITNIGAFSPGSELWSFMAPESVGNIKRLRDNTTLVKYAAESYAATASIAPKPYGMDGPITAFSGSIGGANKTFLYAAMRRGGRSVYAFDVTNTLSTPATPTLKWRIGCSDATTATDCTKNTTTGQDMSGIGQTWSSLKSFTTKSYGNGASPLLIFGGGYDSCEDYDALSATGANNNCTSSSKGAYVYIVDADTGTLKAALPTGQGRSIVADVTLVRDAGGQVILGYTADMGGNVYRITFGTTSATDNSSTWTMTRIASLGCASTSTCVANRKFMFAPSVVTTDTISMDATYTLMLGSGDREKPLGYYASAYSVTNYFFQFTDKPGTASSTFPGSADCGSEIICLASLYPILTSDTPTTAQLQTKKGWYLGLAAHEQVVTSVVTVFGVVTFSTHQPAVAGGTTCSSNLGTTLVYNINYTNAAGIGNAPRYADVAGDGLPPSPVAGQVTLDDGTTVPFCIGCSGDSPLQGALPKSISSATQSKVRSYWYIQK